jgi:branched-chain amino acid aminotransferase
VVIVQPLTTPPRELYVSGARLATVTTQRATDATSGAGAKSSNYLANLLALRLARQQGAHEALIVSGDGTVLEGASSNVFVVSSGRVATPDAGGGILAGITREHVIEAARDMGVPVEERRVMLTDLWTADEVFITSSLRELMPVVQVDDHEVGSGRPGDITRRLHRAFRARTPVAGAALPWE